MTDVVYLYPKSSCPCASCDTQYPVPVGGKTNLSVEACKVSPYFNCYNTVELKREIQPGNKEGWYDLNPQVYTSKVACGFNPVGCKTAPTCPTPSWISQDPRLYSETRADYLTLDRPPMTGKVKLRDIYNKKYDGYGAGFTPYDKIRDGQITYYIDKSIEDAFYKPVFSEPAQETAVLYQDPMGAMKPEYNRKAIINTQNSATDCVKSYPYSLSFVQDSQSYREDLMALQQRKNNQEKWSARWTMDQP
jgi:hypothetical protein